ncbi:unnamed protein product, partial [Candidula unifasciata]
MNFEIPPGLTDLLQDFTVEVLRNRPRNLEEFAAQYFNVLHAKKNGPAKTSGGGSLRFQTDASVNVFDREPSSEEEEDYDDDDEPMPPVSQLSRDRRKSVSAERYDPEADDDNDYAK